MPRIRRWPRLSITVAQAFNVYLLDAQARRYSPKTITHYHTRIEPFVAWLDASGVQHIDEVRAELYMTAAACAPCCTAPPSASVPRSSETTIPTG